MTYTLGIFPSFLQSSFLSACVWIFWYKFFSTSISTKCQNDENANLTWQFKNNGFIPLLSFFCLIWAWVFFLPQPFAKYCQLSFNYVLLSLCYWQKNPGKRRSFILKLFVLFEVFVLRNSSSHISHQTICINRQLPAGLFRAQLKT